MSSNYYYAGISVQNRRPTNMDSVLMKSRTICGEKVCLAAVCDGVGSLADGAYAASATVHMLSNWFENLEDIEQLDLRLRDYIGSVNLAIVTKAKNMGIETACTLSTLLLYQNQYCIVHVGDSRIYTLENGTLKQLTLDHVKDGRLSMAVGHRNDVEPFFTKGSCSVGQRFLLCSDGLYKQMELDRLSLTLQKCDRNHLQETVDQLTEYVIHKGEQDNISVALLINESR